MERVELTTENIIDENVEKLAELFPEVVTEVRESDGTLRHTIDVEALKARVGDVAEGQRERYQFTWPGKREAKQEAYRQIDKCLRPCPEESVDWDTTQNLYIEGDNLDALKLLRNTYAGKIKMIYIDPPYNTGHDFIYDDTYTADLGEFEQGNAAFDAEGRLLDAAYRENKESAGRFHSDWCSMMYPRLLLSRDMLSDDGVMFMSIDDYEQENLRKLCDEVFGAGNFIAQLVWERAYAPKNDAKYVSNSHDYVLMYARNAGCFHIGKLPRTAQANAMYKNPDNDPRGLWRPDNLSVKTYSAANDYPITTPSGRVVEPPAGRCWRLSKNAFFERLHDNRIWFGKNGDAVPSLKRFMSELRSDGMTPTSILFYKEVGHSQEGAKELVKLFDGKGYFDGPKPTRLLERLIRLANLDDDSLVLDFFSGSATTAHALMHMNAELGKHARYILCQLPEPTDEKREAFKDGYKNICEIGKERIRRAGKKIADEIAEENKQPKLGEEPKKVPDIGFRVLKIDSSNFEDVSAEPAEYTQQTLAGLADNLKPGRTAEDLLFQVMPQFQIPLSAKIEKRDINGSSAFSVDDGRLVACFDRNVATETIIAMAKLQPDYAVMRDASFTGDDAVSNFGELFKTYSPATITRVV